MHSATFVLSTGRCGTQWLAEKLGATFGDLLTVTHEPLHNEYRPRLMLGLRTPHRLDLESRETILRHVEGIGRGLETRPYVECGHPCWSALPYLIDRLGERLRIIHLVRHPIPTALSWLTQSAYVPPLLPHLQEKVLLSPFDDGVAFPEYRERWASLHPYEKCLYYWAEVNAFGLRLERETSSPWLRLTFEQLFFGDLETPSLPGFLGLPERPGLLEQRTEVVDKYRFLPSLGVPDLDLRASHPAIAGIAGELGYDHLVLPTSPGPERK